MECFRGTRLRAELCGTLEGGRTMRDPDLVQRAERAAMALERAWGHWRVMHGLGTDPLPPVSSYVGYSLEEPWGQPRVVFGVGAEEAERLAALLAGHDCVGPVHAEVSARPDWRRATSAGAPTGPDRSLDGPGPYGGPAFDGPALDRTLSVPAQAPPGAMETFADRGPDYGVTNAFGNRADIAAGVDRGAGNAREMELTHDDDRANRRRGGWGSAATDGPAVPGAGVREPGRAGPDRAELAQGEPRARRRRTERRGEAGSGELRPADGAWQHGDPAGPLPALDHQGAAAFGGPEQVPFAPAPVSESYDPARSQGPGYGGPRYQGDPPRYQPGPPDLPASISGRTVSAHETSADEVSAPETDAAEAGPGEPSASGPSANGPGASELSAGEPSASELSAGEAGVGQATAGETSASQPSASADSGQSSTRQSATGQARTGQPSTGQPSTGQRGSQTRKASRLRSGRGSDQESGKRAQAERPEGEPAQ